MPDRVRHHPNLIYSLGTQVVTLVEILGQNGKVLHPRGSVGVVIRLPADLEHPYRVRFVDGVEESLNRDQFVLESPEEIEAATVERVPLWNDKQKDHGPF